MQRARKPWGIFEQNITDKRSHWAETNNESNKATPVYHVLYRRIKNKNPIEIFLYHYGIHNILTLNHWQ